MLLESTRRPATTTVEFALASLFTVPFFVGLIVGGMGVYRYNLVAFLAREGSRYASVHGTQYAKDTGGKAVSSSSDIMNYLQSTFANNNWQNLGLNPSQITCSASWNASNSPYRTQVINSQLVPLNNTVSVTITYKWVPEALTGIFGSNVTLTSTSVTPMNY